LTTVTFGYTVKPVYNGATLGAQKSGNLKEVLPPLEGFQSKLVFKLVQPDFAWLLLAGGRYSEVAVNTGLTVF
jgi:hypothetical protein